MSPLLRSPSRMRSMRESRSRHRGRRRRSLRVVLAMLLLGSGTVLSLTAPSAGAVTPAVVVSPDICRQFDPNLVSGGCLMYQSNSGPGYTWLGTYRATDGSVFFCIDYLYDSRIDASAARLSTAGLVNQFGTGIGASEVAALNYLIGARAPNGTSGSPVGDAAIALVIRQVMGDGIRGDGTVVYPPGLKIYGTVQSLPGGTPADILNVAQEWWADASHFRGPWEIRLQPTSPGGSTPLGSVASYSVQVVTPDGHLAAGAPVSFTCSGAVTCPADVVSAFNPQTVSVTPRGLGPYEIRARISGPGGDGQLLVSAWSPHPGPPASNHGVQRGWIAQRVPANATARGAAEIIKATPVLVTQAQPTAVAGDSLNDEVTVTGVPEGYDQPMTAQLYGPYEEKPGAEDCTPDKLAGQVEARVHENGTLRTPAIEVTAGGYYTWVEVLPESDSTNAITTPCGLVEETTRVLDRPQLQTNVSDTRVSTPGVVFDTISVAGVSSGSIDIEWTLLGPILASEQGCAGLDWSDAPIRATGQVQSGTGTVRTPDVSITVTGCYTYRERSAATESAVESDSPAGLPAETFLAARPPLRIVPEVPTGPASVLLPPSWFDALTTGLAS